jgi:hypothetical protein
VTLVTGPTDNSTTHDEGTTWTFPVDISTCGVTVSVVGNGAYYAVYGTPPGPLAQVARLDHHRLYVNTEWGGGTGADFSLLVTCP